MSRQLVYKTTHVDPCGVYLQGMADKIWVMPGHRLVVEVERIVQRDRGDVFETKVWRESEILEGD